MFLFVWKLTSVHPETPEGANWSFQFINEQFAARSRKPRDCAEAYFTYAAQEIPKIDVEIVAKGHLWMETNQIPSQLQVHNGTVHNGMIFAKAGIRPETRFSAVILRSKATKNLLAQGIPGDSSLRSE